MGQRIEMKYCSVAACLLLLLGTSWPSVVTAQEQPTSAPEKAAAIALADQGWAHYKAGRYAEAINAFREAEQRIHAPTFLLMVARCYVQMGRLLEARAVYQHIVDEKLAPGAPPEFVAAQADARKELAAMQMRIPTVEIVEAGTLPETLKLTLDGLPIDLSVPVQRDPGNHTLVVLVPGHRPLTKVIGMGEGAKERVELDQAAIDALPTVERPAAERTPSPGVSVRAAQSLSSAPTTPRDDVRTAVLVGGGIAAGASVAAGVVLTVLANGQAGDAEKLRQELVTEGDGFALCPDINSSKCAKLKDTVFTKVDLTNSAFWSFVAGGTIGVGTLVYGLVTMKPTESRPAVQVVPLVGMGASGLLVSGTF
ncbi:tetratricopeptide repeat protein [Sorangium sp. So ce381]|uniref:tetratricopeptide repeat protein n=1 Tax=Sorangium sp. So ce381 TaxID=3133307 RepID=UPI003F5CB522